VDHSEVLGHLLLLQLHVLRLGVRLRGSLQLGQLHRVALQSPHGQAHQRVHHVVVGQVYGLSLLQDAADFLLPLHMMTFQVLAQPGEAFVSQSELLLEFVVVALDDLLLNEVDDCAVLVDIEVPVYHRVDFVVHEPTYFLLASSFFDFSLGLLAVAVERLLLEDGLSLLHVLQVGAVGLEGGYKLPLVLVVVVVVEVEGVVVVLAVVDPQEVEVAALHVL